MLRTLSLSYRLTVECGIKLIAGTFILMACMVLPWNGFSLCSPYVTIVYDDSHCSIGVATLY